MVSLCLVYDPNKFTACSAQAILLALYTHRHVCIRVVVILHGWINRHRHPQQACKQRFGWGRASHRLRQRYSCNVMWSQLRDWVVGVGRCVKVHYIQLCIQNNSVKSFINNMSHLIYSRKHNCIRIIQLSGMINSKKVTHIYQHINICM